MKLPKISDFNEAYHPELLEIFQHIDVAIAAIVASDPAMRPGLTNRRVRAKAAETARPARTRKSRRNAA